MGQTARLAKSGSDVRLLFSVTFCFFCTPQRYKSFATQRVYKLRNCLPILLIARKNLKGRLSSSASRQILLLKISWLQSAESSRKQPALKSESKKCNPSTCKTSLSSKNSEEV